MQYHKIQSLYKRDPENKYRTFLPDYARSEFFYLDTIEWCGQEKLDGMNMRAEWDPEAQIFYVYGKTTRAVIPADLMAFMHHHFQPSSVPGGLVDKPFTFFGEGIGEGIQKGGAYGKRRFVGFDVRVHHEWLEQWEVELYAARFGVDYAHPCYSGDLDDAVEMVKEGFPSAHGARQAEGLILRPPLVLLNSQGERIITKLKTKDFE